MSNGILDTIADTAIGAVSGNRRFENFQQRKNPQNELELLNSKRKALENMTSEYKQRLMERQGVNREMDLDIGSSYDSYIKAFKSAEDADFADTLTKGYKTQNLIAGVGNEIAGLAALAGVLPGVTMEGIYESLRTPIKYNRDLMGDLTPDEDRFIQDFIEENSIAVQGGRAVVLVPEVIATLSGINPKMINRINSFVNKRNTGEKLTAAENRQMLSDVDEIKKMYARPTQKLITKPAPIPDELSEFKQITEPVEVRSKSKKGKEIKYLREPEFGRENTYEIAPGKFATAEQITEAKKLFNEGTLQKEIQEKIGRSEPIVRAILKSSVAEKGGTRTIATISKIVDENRKKLIKQLEEGKLQNVDSSMKANILDQFKKINDPKFVKKAVRERTFSDVTRSFDLNLNKVKELQEKAKGLFTASNAIKSLQKKGVKINKQMLSQGGRQTEVSEVAAGVQKILKPQQIKLRSTPKEIREAKKVAEKKGTKLVLDEQGAVLGRDRIFVKPLTDNQTQKLKKTIEENQQPTLMIDTAERVLKYLDDPILGTELKNGRLPSLKEFMTRTNDGPSTIGTAIAQLVRRLDGSKYKTPYATQKGGKRTRDSRTIKTTQDYDKIRRNRIRAEKIFEQLGQQKEGLDTFYNQFYDLMSENLDNVLGKTTKTKNIKRNIRDTLKSKYKIVMDDINPMSVNIHEPSSIIASGRADIPSFSNFVRLEKAGLNQGLIRRTQAELSKSLQRILEDPKKFTTEARRYNQLIDREIAKHLRETGENLEGRFVYIRKPSHVRKQFTREELDRFKEDYGMFLEDEAKKAGFSLELPEDVIPVEDLLQETPEAIEMINKAKAGFNQGGRVTDEIQDRRDAGREYDNGRFVVDNLQNLESVKALQEQIKKAYESEIAVGIRDASEKKFEEIQEDAKKQLRNERPVKFKASELANAAEEFVFKPAGTLMTAPVVGALNTIEFAYNSARKGVENDVDMKEKFPSVYKLFDYYTSGIGPTPDEQTYVGFIDESIRSVQKGGQNLAYSVLDLAFTIPDFAFDTKLQEELQKAYDEKAFADPETFLGDAGSILVEFGVPSTVAFKFLNMLRRGLKARTGVNLMTTSTYGMKGAEKAKTAISNVAKRVGVVAPSAFLGEFVGGGPYNTVSREFADDPLFLDETLGYDYIDTRELSGKELQIANFKNRIRFGTDGAIVAGMFPLLGPALAKATKNGLIKPSAYIAGKGLQAVNYLGIKPVSYLLARTPGVSQTGQIAAKGLSLGAQFLGKDVLARAAVGLMGTPTLKQLPDFKDWRMFEVTSEDPLQKNLKRFDNFLSFFRDSANQSANRFFLTGQTERKIKATSRKIEKQLDIIEKRAYDLARGFLKDYNTNTTSPAKQQYYLDQVISYLKGQVKLVDLPTQLQNPAEALNKNFINIKREFTDVLPDGAGLKDYLNTNLREYMRASFASFTNPLYKPDKKLVDRAVDFMVDRINKNENMIETALRASNLPPEEAIKSFAKKQVESILQRGKADGQDPLETLQFIARDNLKMDDLVVQTGEELPDVIKKLLGEEKSLRTSVMTTASDLASQTANVQMYDKLTGLGLREGWLFSSAEEAIAAGIADPKKVGPRLPGLGKLDSSISEAYGNKEIIDSIVGSSGILDDVVKNSLYQNLLAYKAMVQTGKTVFSPATQTRNFGSASFFPLQSGHIGGAASVTDAFKIILDDVFGAGKTLNEQELIDRIARKVELGVLDENVVVSELKDILKDVKSGNMRTLAKFSNKVDNTKLADVATRLYAGGDNVWKWYGHEFVMSQLKNGFKNVDELALEYKKVFGADIKPKNLQEGLEQYAASLIRDTYPTYSKVPKAIQAIRKLFFIGNFVSFPAEILRTTFATTGIALKHIASDNAALRELGYRTLMGQFITYGGIGAGTAYLGQAMTNVTTQELEDIKRYFVPEFMRFSDLVPLTNVEDGVVKVFDNSRYFPYDLITATVGNAINRAFTQREQLDPEQIETDMFRDIYNYSGPLADLAGGTFLGVSIGYEPALDFLRGGKTKTGRSIYSKTDTTLEKFDKMFAHTFDTINPGFIRTLENLYGGAAGALTGTGQPIKFTDQMFKVLGGSSVTIDVPGSLRYQVGKLKSSFKEPRVSEGFFRPDFRTAAQLVREYNEQNEEAFREQYEFFKVVRAALRNDFMSEDDVFDVLKERVGKKTAYNVIDGIFTPLSISEGALEGRYENIKRGNPKQRFRESEYLPIDDLENAKDDWMDLNFEDYERELKEPKQRKQMSEAPATQPVDQEPQTPQLPDTAAAQPGPPPVASVPNPATGLTPVESSLLSREEQRIRQRQRGLA